MDHNPTPPRIQQCPQNENDRMSATSAAQNPAYTTSPLTTTPRAPRMSQSLHARQLPVPWRRQLPPVHRMWEKYIPHPARPRQTLSHHRKNLHKSRHPESRKPRRRRRTHRPLQSRRPQIRLQNPIQTTLPPQTTKRPSTNKQTLSTQPSNTSKKKQSPPQITPTSSASKTPTTPSSHYIPPQTPPLSSSPGTLSSSQTSRQTTTTTSKAPTRTVIQIDTSHKHRPQKWKPRRCNILASQEQKAPEPTPCPKCPGALIDSKCNLCSTGVCSKCDTCYTGDHQCDPTILHSNKTVCFPVPKMLHMDLKINGLQPDVLQPAAKPSFHMSKVPQ